MAQGQGQSGTLQKMIVENGSVTMELDLNRLNGIGSAIARPYPLQFTVAANSFFTILVFNDLLRGPEQGSIALIPAGVNAPGYSLPMSLGTSVRQLAVENFLPAQRLILPCATTRAGLSFSISKDISTITTAIRGH